MGTVFFFVLLAFHSQGELLFPHHDPLRAEKQNAINETLLIFPKNSSVETVLQSNKVVLWANSVLMKNPETNEITTIHVPNFSAVSANNESFLRSQIEESCQCSLMGKEIGGILVAHPYQAAEMYFREGWQGHSADEIDGYAPPIAIIYHEFSHASDYLKDQNYFFDIASLMSKQWKNGAEESAVVQQNDFVRSANAAKGTNFSMRRSYGKNQLYMTSGLYSIERLN